MMFIVWNIFRVTSLYTESFRELTLKFSYFRIMSSGFRDLLAVDDLLMTSSCADSYGVEFSLLS